MFAAVSAQRAEGDGGQVGFAGPAAVDAWLACARYGCDAVERHTAVTLLRQLPQRYFENQASGKRHAEACATMKAVNDTSTRTRHPNAGCR